MSNSNHIHEIKHIGPYEIRGVIGEGSFSIVRLAYNEEKNKHFACKQISRHTIESKNLKDRFEEEVRINQQMNHPGIVRLIDLMKDEYNYYIFMEFCPNGDLFQYVVDRGKLDENDCKRKIRQILIALQHLHKLGVSHRDLKPENILLDQYCNPKISDFGLSKFVREMGMVNTPCGSPCYASPECISGLPYNGFSNDVWSCGVIVYALSTGKLPWTKRNNIELFEQIRRGEYKIPTDLSPKLQSFIRGLLTVDLNKRMTLNQALEHPWLEDAPTSIEVSESLPIVSLKKIDSFFYHDSTISIRGSMSGSSAELASFDMAKKVLRNNNRTIKKAVKIAHSNPKILRMTPLTVAKCLRPKRSIFYNI